jgi:membrane-bound ClpP family serine protease
MLDSPILPNLLYLVLVAGLWFAALSIVTPGTGFYEGLAIVALIAAGLGTMIVPMNAWALIPMVLGLALFGISVWRSREGYWLAVAAIVLTVGSAFLFQREGGGPAVNPWLALATSLLTVGFFWLIVRTSLEAHSAAPTHDPSKVLGQTGEVRTLIDPVGSAYVGGELWTATASSSIPEGSSVKVVDRDGLMIVVEPEQQS